MKGGHTWKEGSIDGRISRMFYFCQIWAGISGTLGLNASLSIYKDKYIIGREKEMETCGVIDV